MESSHDARRDPGGQLRMLVVDDDPLIRSVVVEMLSLLDVRVDAVASVAEAARSLESIPVDVIVSDLVFDGALEGSDFLEQARAHEWCTAAVLISGVDQQKMSELVPEGSHFFLRKPFRLNELLDAIRHEFGEHPALRVCTRLT